MVFLFEVGDLLQALELEALQVKVNLEDVIWVFLRRLSAELDVGSPIKHDFALRNPGALILEMEADEILIWMEEVATTLGFLFQNRLPLAL